MDRHVIGWAQRHRVNRLTRERRLLCAVALEGDLTRFIGDVICGDGGVVGDLLDDESCQPSTILVRPVTVEQPV